MVKIALGWPKRQQSTLFHREKMHFFHFGGGAEGPRPNFQNCILTGSQVYGETFHKNDENSREK